MQTLSCLKPEKSKKSSPLIDFLRKQELFDQYESLSKLDYHDLTVNDMEKLREILKDVVKKTDNYVSTMKVSRKIEAMAMQKQYKSFIKILKAKNDAVTIEVVKELDIYWKTVDIFFVKNYDKMPDFAYLTKTNHDEDKSEYRCYANFDVDEAMKWINNNPTLFYKKQRIEVIKESLKKANSDPELSYFINLTILQLGSSSKNKDLTQWIKKLYVYDENEIKKCCIAYTNDNYYVDEYGNCFLNEKAFLEKMAKFTEISAYMSSNGVNHNVNIPTDKDFLQETLKCFTSIKISHAFKSFFNDCQDSTKKAITILKKVKNFYYLFWTLDHRQPQYLISLSFSLINDELRILFPDLQLHRICTKKYVNLDKLTSFEKKEKNFDTECIKNVITHLNFQPKIEEYAQQEREMKFMDQNILEMEKAEVESLLSVLCFKNSSHNYKFLCYFMAAKIVLYIKSQPEYETKISIEKISIRYLKYIALWMTLKFKDEKEIADSLLANEKFLISDFCKLLLAVIDSKKSKNHQFENFFTAAYHFMAHYESIRIIIQKNIKKPGVKQNFPFSKKYPALTEKNLKQCVSFYLKELPDYIFKNETKKDDGHSDEGEGCVIFYYEDSIIPIVGIKYENKTDMQCSKNVFIKTIRQKI